MPTKKMIADTVFLEVDPAYGKLKLGWGQEFYQHQGQLHLNITPLSDPTLSAVETLLATDDSLEFSTSPTGKPKHFAIETFFTGTHIMTKFLETLYRDRIQVAGNYKDNLHILLEEDGFMLRLINPTENKRIILNTSRRHGNFFVQRFPEPSRKFALLSCHIADKSQRLEIICDGNDLHQPTTHGPEFSYVWNLDIQPAFLETVTSLIRAGFTHGVSQTK
jgi:hypothetical protein